MATNTSGGTTASFYNTPQAKDDYTCAYEDGVFCFDVMANDLGGNAKILWSIDDTTMTDDSGNGSIDLLTRDGLATSCPEYSDLGAKISIVDGIVKYDTNALDWLAEGQQVCDKFTYAIRLSNGTLSWATVYVTLTGTNDGPDIFVATGDKAADTLAETNAGLTTSGHLSVTDPDTSDTVGVVVSSVAASGSGASGAPGNPALLAMLSLSGNVANAADGTPGSLGWAFDSHGEAFDYLAVGESLVLTYTLTGTDSSSAHATDTQTVTITITGTNDAPTITSPAQSGGVTEKAEPGEGGTLSSMGSITFHDADLTDTHSASVLATVKDGDGNAFASPLGSLSLGAVDQAGDSVAWTFTVDASATDFLAAGQTLTQVYTVQISDGHAGGTTTQDVAITITGTNDKPTITAATTDADGGVTEDATNPTLSDTGTIAFNDVDLTDTHTATAVPAAGNTLGGTLTMGTPSESATTEGGTVGWTYNVANSATQYLGDGETATEKFTVTISDGHGGTVDQLVTVTVTGTNDGPDIFVATGDKAAETLAETDLPLSTSGHLTVTDPDTSDTVSVTVSSVAASGSGAPGAPGNPVLLDMLSLTGNSGNAADGTAGSVGWLFASTPTTFDYLAVGESLVLTYTLTATDSSSAHATDSQTVVITITGTNDKPVIETGAAGFDVTGAVVEKAEPAEGGLLADNGLITFSDVDASDHHSASFAAQGSGYLGTFALVDSDPLTDGVQTAAGSVGWTFSVDDSALDYLAAGQQLVQKYDVTVDDGHGGTAVQTVTVTITGTNDKPVIETGATGFDASGAVVEKAEPIDGGTLGDSGLITFSDVDATDTHTASFAPAASGYLGTFALVDADPDTDGVQTAPGSVGWTFSVDDSALDYLADGQKLTQTYNVTVDDGHGGTAVQAVTVTLTGTNDKPTITSGAQAGTVVEDSATTPSPDDSGVAGGTVTFNDVDLSDGHTAGFAAAETNTTALGSFALGTVSEAANAANGSVGWTYTIDETAAQYLADGQSVTETYTVTVNDGHGGTASQDVTVTITGTNDDPVISLVTTDSSSALLTEGDAALTKTGTLTVRDVDLTDTVTTGVTLGTVTGNRGGLSDASLLAMLTASPASGLAAQPTDTHNLTWSFDSGTQAFNFLAAGQSLQVTYTLTVSDGHGGTDTQDVTVTIGGTNDAPVLTGDHNATVAEGGSYVITAADLGFTDPDDSAANVTFTATGLSNGTLIVDGSIATSFTGQQLADGLVSFAHDGSETSSAGFSISVEDGNEDLSTPVAQPFSFTVTPVNDAPVNATPAAQTVDEDTALVFGTAHGNAISISDADAGSGNVEVKLTVGHGTLTLGSTTGITITGGADGSATVTIQGTLADVNTALNGLSYTGNANFNGADSLSIATSDLGNTGAGGAKTDSDSVAITVNPVNDAPALTGTAATLANGTEDQPYTVTKAQLLQGWTDVDGDTLSVTNLAATNGTVTDNGDGTYTVTPTGNFNGPVTLNYYVSDGTAPVAASLGYTVDAVNDAPVATIALATYSATEGVALDLKTAGLSISDVDANGASMTVTLSVGEGSLNGTVGNSGVSLSGNGTSSLTITGLVSQVNAFLGAIGSSSTLAYVDNNDTPAASTTLTLTVNDNGHTGSGGPQSSFDTATINITAVNDAPVNVIPATFATNEDTAVKLAGLSVSDADAGSAGMSVTLSVDSGTLSAADAGGVTVTGSGTASIVLSGSQADINAYLAAVASQPTFAPAANANGAVTLTMSSSDNGNSGTGGTKTDVDTSTISVTSVNDAPAGTDGTVFTIEDNSKTFAAADFGFTDANDSPANAFDSVTIVTLPGAGVLKLDGVAVTAGQVVSVSDINAGKLTFVPTPDVAGTTSLTFQVHDDGGTANGGVNLDPSANTLIIEITPVNDAPVNSVPGGQSATAGTALAIGGVSVFDSDSGNLTTTLSVGHGTLSVSSIVGLTITGNGSGSVTLSGDQFSINQALNGLSYTATGGYSGPDTMTMHTSDGVLADDDSVGITVATGRQAPTDIHLTMTSPLADQNNMQFGITGTLSATDPDPGTFTYAFTGGASSVIVNGTMFGLSGSTLTSNNLAAGQTYALAITATQTGDGLLSTTETFTIITGSNGNQQDNLSGQTGDDVMYAGPAADMLFGLGGDDTLFGHAGNDTLLSGDAGNDTIYGGGGNDALNGGLGNDILNGGANNDFFIFDTALDGLNNHDEIQDFDASGNDHIQLDDAIFAGIANSGASLNSGDFVANVGGNATTATQNILYDTATGNLYYDPDGNGAAAKILFAHLTVTAGTVDASDFIVI